MVEFLMVLGMIAFAVFFVFCCGLLAIRAAKDSVVWAYETAPWVVLFVVCFGLYLLIGLATGHWS